MPTPQIFTSVINQYLPEPQASLLNGIIFGIKLNTDKVFYQQIRNVGLLHLVVLSGVNITLLATVVGGLASYFGKRFSILITIPIIVLFIVFVGVQAPIVRAGFMGILTFVGVLFERKTYTLFTLLLSLFFILIFWPSWIITVSLQLSYAATLGLILFSDVKRKKLVVKNKDRKEIEMFIDDLKFFLLKGIKPTFAAQVFSTPIIFIYFKQISLISPLANLLVSFTIPPLMVFGFLTAFLGKINLFLGLFPSYICYGLLSYVIFIIKLLSHLPFCYLEF